MESFKWGYEAVGEAKISMECQMITDRNRVYVWYMSVLKGSHVETGIECPLDKMALLE